MQLTLPWAGDIEHNGLEQNQLTEQNTTAQVYA